METMTDFIFLGSKITEDSDCSHETMMLAPWKKRHDKTINLIKKQRHYSADIHIAMLSFFQDVRVAYE